MEIDMPDVVAEVRGAFNRYEQALVSNDVETLDALFRDDPRTVRFGGTEAICERAKIGRSRRKELLQIGRGSKTIEQSRRESAERQTRSRATKKARAVTVTAPASAHAANETDAGPTAKPKPAPSDSVEALAEFKAACDLWLPQLNERDREQSVDACEQHVRKAEEQPWLAGASGLSDVASMAVAMVYPEPEKDNPRQKVENQVAFRN